MGSVASETDRHGYKRGKPNERTLKRIARKSVSVRAAHSDCFNADTNGAGRFFRAYHFPDRSKPDEADESESGERNDSVWAIVAGTVKAYNFSLEYVLYDLSYANLIMLGAVLPTYDSAKGKGKGDKKTNQKVINAEDPANKAAVDKIFELAD